VTEYDPSINTLIIIALYVTNGANPMKKRALYTAGDERKVFNVLCGKDKETFFIVCNQLTGPLSFLIIGVFFPKFENHPQDALSF
jgi:hypothetical protein